ncbi:MAG: FeoA family protein [Fibrobacter sp.]|nr:FeoA family protein [Fibrobacter sp.]
MICEKTNSGCLSDFKEGDNLIVQKIEGEGAFKRRLLEMGFTTGTCVSIVKYAPLRDPVEIQVKNTCISLRVCEARKIIVLPNKAACPKSFGHKE